MRVLFLLRSDAGTLASGPTEQVRQYAAAVTERGGEAVVSAGIEPPSGRFDVAHLFNVDWPLETASHLETARAHADRMVLSPIHHRRSWEEAYHRVGRDGLSRRVAAVTGLDGFVRLRGLAQARTAPHLRREALQQLARGPHRRQAQMLDHSQAWLVTCERETESIVQDFEVAPKPSIVVPNGADWVDGAKAAPGLPAEFILSVGRIETRKNQLGLARAVVELGMPAVFVGVPNPRHRDYARRFESYVDQHPSLTWLRAPSRGERLALFGRARLHALASWYEVQPLVDSEAAVAGCTVLTTTRGYTRETLGDEAEYWEPDTGHAGLVARLAAALGRPLDGGARERFRERLSWTRIRDDLAAVYGL